MNVLGRGIEEGGKWIRVCTSHWYKRVGECVCLVCRLIIKETMLTKLFCKSLINFEIAYKLIVI